MHEPMKLRVEKKDGKNIMMLDNQEIRGVMEYKIESPGHTGFAELSIKLAVKYPVEQN